MEKRPIGNRKYRLIVTVLAEFSSTTRCFVAFPSLRKSRGMLKRRASGPKAVRKKKKGNATYTISSFGPSDDEGKVAEDIRVWDISASEKTGRMNASRTTLKHYSKAPPPEELSTNQKPGGVEGVASAEDTGSLADSEIPPKTSGKQRPKRKRVRTTKENDSVRE